MRNDVERRCMNEAELGIFVAGEGFQVDEAEVRYFCGGRGVPRG